MTAPLQMETARVICWKIERVILMQYDQYFVDMDGDLISRMVGFVGTS